MKSQSIDKPSRMIPAASRRCSERQDNAPILRASGWHDKQEIEAVRASLRSSARCAKQPRGLKQSNVKCRRQREMTFVRRARPVSVKYGIYALNRPMIDDEAAGWT